jgi:hypothetical protein
MPNGRKIRLQPPPTSDPPHNEVGYRRPPTASKRFQRFIEDDIAHEKHLRDMIAKALGKPQKRNGFAR